ncbi:Neurochondrin-domain-containing protein [Nemania sp. FL0916]|nr:Neurochondrin-domain-containing protein [Nemania sp. FL0916]
MELPEVQKIHQLLAAKDDTSRFVGLLLLKTTLDNHASDLQHEQVEALWNSISSRFLDRLIRTGSRPATEQQKQSGDTLDVAVAVIYTFTKLLNDCAISERFYARIPNLANAVLYSSGETTGRIVDLIHVLVQQPDGQAAGGASCFAGLDMDSWKSLIEIAPQHNTVFSIFHWSWVKGSHAVPAETMQKKISDALLLFVSSFKGQNPTTLLDFIALLFDNLRPDLRPSNHQWLRPIANLIHDMASSKQTENGRRAFTQCAAVLLASYPEEAPELLFSDAPDNPKPVAYLFMKMVQVDVLSTLHLLIPKLFTPDYPALSTRIAAALDITTAFIGFLITAADDDDILQRGLTPDRILKLHEDLIKMVGDVMEYLRDRWDNFLAGTRGIEPAQALGQSVFEDSITPAAIRLAATWLRDDDGNELRTQAAGLVDLFAELYKMNLASSTDVPEVRLPVLAALEGILQTSDGRDAFNESDMLSGSLYPDFRIILVNDSTDLTTSDYIRGSAITQVFLILLENDENLQFQPGPTDLLELITKYDAKLAREGAGILTRSCLDFQTNILELATAVLNASSRHTLLAFQQKTRAALKVIASQVKENWRALDDEDMAARVAELGLD